MARSLPMPPDDRRASLLLAARQVFAARGYHSASVAHIIAAAGVARGTFYNYFESKRTAFQAVLEELTAELAASARPIDLGTPIAPQVEANVVRVLHSACAPDLARILFTGAVGIDPEGDAALGAFYEHGLGRIEAALRLGQGLGVVVPGDPPMLAQILLGMVKEPVFQATLRGEALDPDRLVPSVIQVLTGGIIRIEMGIFGDASRQSLD
jgi:AcrR family transcriptional regulator